MWADGYLEYECMSDVVVSFDFPPMIGGAHKWLYEIYSRWPTEVHVLTERYSKDPQKLREQRAFDGQAHNALKISRRARVLPRFDLFSVKYPGYLWGQVSAIGELLRAGKYDEANGSTLHALRAVPEGLAAWTYCRIHPGTTRLVTYVHGEEVLVSQTSRQLRLLSRRVYEDSDLLIANSESTRRILEHAYPNVKSVCIHPGVDAQSFRAARKLREGVRSRLGFQENTIVVLILARMEARKNHAMLIRAIAKLRQQGMPIALICGGDGPERETLDTLTSELGVSQNVRFVGAISEQEKPMIYSAADIFAMPSITVGQMIEGFGIVFIEAAAAGLPTICGRTGGQREAILEGISGFSVDGTVLDDVTEKIRQLAISPELRRQFGDVGQTLAEQHDWSVLVQKVQSEVEQRKV